MAHVERSAHLPGEEESDFGDSIESGTVRVRNRFLIPGSRLKFVLRIGAFTLSIGLNCRFQWEK